MQGCSIVPEQLRCLGKKSQSFGGHCLFTGLD